MLSNLTHALAVDVDYSRTSIVFRRPLDIQWISWVWVANQIARKTVFTTLLHTKTIDNCFPEFRKQKLNIWVHLSKYKILMLSVKAVFCRSYLKEANSNNKEISKFKLVTCCSDLHSWAGGCFSKFVLYFTDVYTAVLKYHTLNHKCDVSRWQAAHLSPGDLGRTVFFPVYLRCWVTACFTVQF